MGRSPVQHAPHWLLILVIEIRRANEAIISLLLFCSLIHILWNGVALQVDREGGETESSPVSIWTLRQTWCPGSLLAPRCTADDGDVMRECPPDVKEEVVPEDEYPRSYCDEAEEHLLLSVRKGKVT